MITATSNIGKNIAKACAYLGKEPALIDNICVVIKHNQNPKYLAYALSTNNSQKQKIKLSIAAGLFNITFNSIKQIKIPLPSLEEQAKIVELLDKFSELSKELKKELDLRKKQYEYYRDKLLSFKQDNKIKWVTLGEIFKFVGGFAFEINKYKNSGLPILRINNISNGLINEEGLVFFSKEDYSENLDSFILKPNDLFISNAGTLKIGFNDKNFDYWINQRIYRLDIKEKGLNWKYLFHWLINNLYYISSKSSSSNMVPNWSTTKMKQIKIPIPSSEEQEEIANLLDKFWELSNNIKDGLPSEILLTQQRYEYYRDKLLN